MGKVTPSKPGTLANFVIDQRMERRRRRRRHSPAYTTGHQVGNALSPRGENAAGVYSSAKR